MRARTRPGVGVFADDLAVVRVTTRGTGAFLVRLGCDLELVECVSECWSGVAVVRHEDPVQREQPRPGRLGKVVVVRDPCPC